MCDDAQLKEKSCIGEEPHIAPPRRISRGFLAVSAVAFFGKAASVYAASGT
jgi:hypothetical protein